jgi:RNA polymerase sigma-70 factor, ECF subfamily
MITAQALGPLGMPAEAGGTPEPATIRASTAQAAHAAAADQALRALMVRYQQGDVDAFDALYRRTLPIVRGYLTAISRERAADLAQESFLQAHRSRHTYDPAYPVTPWLLGIARHVWRMDQRTWWRRQSREMTGLESLPELPVAPEMDRLADRDTLARALAGVRADRREAVMLHHVYGLSFQEVAAVVGTSETAARVRACRGMADLRATLTAGTARGERRHD